MRGESPLKPDGNDETGSEAGNGAAPDGVQDANSNAPVGSDAPLEPGGDGALSEGAEQSSENNLDDFADSLGVKKKDVYDLEIPVGDEGETLSLGKLKDFYKDTQRNTVASEERELRHETERTDLLVARNEVAQLAQKILPFVPDGLRGEILAEAQTESLRERELMLAAFPEWRDPVRYESDRSDMTQFVSRFGFSERELAGLADHRIANMLVHAMRTEERLNKLTSRKPEPKDLPKGQGRTGRATGEGKAAKTANARGGSRESKIAAVSALLKGQK